MSITEKRIVQSADAVASFILDRLDHGAGNGHFVEEGLHYRYYRNGKLMLESEGTVVFDNGQCNQITIPEITEYDSPRLMDVFYSTRDIFTYNNNMFKITGGRKNSGDCGRYEVEIW